MTHNQEYTILPIVYKVLKVMQDFYHQQYVEHLEDNPQGTFQITLKGTFMGGSFLVSLQGRFRGGLGVW